jgi:prepilin-type N-terminal cleavage/methylation domain-containing protein
MGMKKRKGQKGFSLVELIIATTVMLILLSIVSTLIARAFSVRQRESRRSDALVSVQAALNVISREVGNSGFGIYSDSLTRVPNNGMVLGDSNDTRIHMRSNMWNQGDKDDCDNSVPDTACMTDQPGEDVTYYLDPTSQSIVRYDPNDTPTTSVVVNRVSSLKFHYFHYDPSTGVVTDSATPTASTSRVRITVEAVLERVVGQVNPSSVTYESQVTLRNASYMLKQY